MAWSIEIPGNPIPKKRHRTVRNKHTGIVNSYDPQREEKEAYGLIIEASKPICYENEPIALKLYFLLPIPKSFSKKQTEQAIDWELMPSKRPDLDNYIKFIMDCCNGILYKDDSQVVFIESVKAYSTEPHTQIKVWPYV